MVKKIIKQKGEKVAVAGTSNIKEKKMRTEQDLQIF